MPFDVAIITFVPGLVGLMLYELAHFSLLHAQILEDDSRPGWAFGFFAVYGVLAVGSSLVMFGWLVMMQAEIISILIAKG